MCLRAVSSIFGGFTVLVHEIDTGDAPPVEEKMRRTPVFFAGEEEARLKKMLDVGVIQPYISEWASALVLIRKKAGQVRWCLDYRRLNNVIKKDVFPLPLIDECLDTLSRNVWFSKLDANSAFHKIKIRPEDQRKTAFITRYGLYKFAQMGFQLCNAPATFSSGHELAVVGPHLEYCAGPSGSPGQPTQCVTRFREFHLKFKP